MGKIDELLDKLCPEGVPYLSIGDIAVDIYRGAGIKRDQVTEKGTPCVRYGEIYTTYGLWFEECVSHTDESMITSRKYFEHGDILFAITGESVEDIAKSCAYMGHERCLAGGDIVVLKHNQNPKYVSYALSTKTAVAQKGKGKIKSKVVHSSVPAIKEIIIPVPPLEIQQEIVDIIDALLEKEQALIGYVDDELRARKLQHDYYISLMMKSLDGYASSRLREVVSFRNGKGHEKEIISDGKYVVVNSKFISTNGQVKKYSNDQICPLYVDDILMVMSDLPNGKALARCFIVDEDDKYTLNQRIGAFHVASDAVTTSYLFYILNRNLQLLAYDNGIDQTNLRKDDILNIMIPIPDKTTQTEFVGTMERIEQLFQELIDALQLEIDARKKQFEYYKDGLLDFSH